MCDLKTRRRPIWKKVKTNRGKLGSLKFIGPVVRPLWRASSSGAKAPQLAARPVEFVPRNLSFRSGRFWRCSFSSEICHVWDMSGFCEKWIIYVSNGSFVFEKWLNWTLPSQECVHFVCFGRRKTTTTAGRSQKTEMNESCLTYEHIRNVLQLQNAQLWQQHVRKRCDLASHVSHINEWREIWMSHVLQIFELLDACKYMYGQVTSHNWMCHVKQMNESCQTNVRGLACVCARVHACVRVS